MSIVDRYGTRHSSDVRQAIDAFEIAVHGIAAHQPSSGEALKTALALDPGLVSAHALKGLANVILAREELLPVARQAFADASAARAAVGGTDSENALVDALAFAIDGRLLKAAGRLEAHLDRNPREFLPCKLSHALRFMAGDQRGMLLTTTRVLDSWSTDLPGYGFLLGCHAFGLEEIGEMDAAERIGRRAVAIEPDDSWGLHAVSHVHEMQGRTAEGIAWLEQSRPVWRRCNNFSFHMAWHLALFHLEKGDHGRVLALYDEQVRPTPTDDFRDVANAVSLLWRLKQEGVPVDQRWDEVRSIALKRRNDTTLTFAALHNLLALVATGELSAARELVAALNRKARSCADDQANVIDIVGRDLAVAIVQLATGGRSKSAIDRLALRLQHIGGSHAQRDVFLRTLAGIAADQGDRRALDQVLSVRRRLKQDDRFVFAIQARIGGDERLLATG